MAKIKDLLGKHGFKKQEEAKTLMLDPVESSYPEALKRHKLIYSKTGASIEEPYFWVLDHIRELRGYRDVTKIKDVFTAAESSAMFGAQAQRLSIQQDRVTQYLAQIGKFMKDLFQMVREIRIIEMRVKMYEDSRKGDKTADMALKGIWVDMVEGGTKNATSVLGLSREVGFTILPDLFFGTHIKNTGDVQKTIEKLKFNEKIKEVLARKLYAYMTWRDSTESEVTARRGFMIKYLRQHYSIIRAYMKWIRPYLTHIKRLQMNTDALGGADIVSAFETATIELEQLFKKPLGIGKDVGKEWYKVLLVSYNYRVRPGMEYHQDGYQHKGPQHWGRVEIDFRAYVWSEEQVKEYLSYREEEDLELLGALNESINAAMDELGTDLKRYLSIKGENLNLTEEEIQTSLRNLNELYVSGGFTSNKGHYQELKKELEQQLAGIKSKDKRKVEDFTLSSALKTILSPATNIINGLTDMTIGREIFTDEPKKRKNKPQTKHQLWLEENAVKAASGEGSVQKDLFLVYNIFKKGHRMINW